MRTFTLEEYKGMAERFNKMSFANKIKTIQRNSDILILASDHNWWGVKVKDKEIQEELYDNGWQFNIVNEWDSDEMHTLIHLLGLEVTDI